MTVCLVVCQYAASMISFVVCFFFFQAEDGIRDLVRSRGLGDVYKRQVLDCRSRAAGGPKRHDLRPPGRPQRPPLEPGGAGRLPGRAVGGGRDDPPAGGRALSLIHISEPTRPY